MPATCRPINSRHVAAMQQAYASLFSHAKNLLDPSHPVVTNYVL